MNLKSSSRQGHRKIAGRNRIAKNRRWRLLRISNEVSYAILPGGQRILVHDSGQNTNTHPIHRIRSISRAIGNVRSPLSHEASDSLSAGVSIADQKSSGPNPDSWGIMEEPLLPVGDWMPAIRLGDRSTNKAQGTPMPAPAVSSEEMEKPLRIKAETVASTPTILSPMALTKEIPTTPAHTTSSEQNIDPNDEADEEEDSLIRRPAPGGSPDRSGGIVGFLSRIFKT